MENIQIDTKPDDNKEDFDLYRRERTGPWFSNKIVLLLLFVIIGLLIYIFGRKEVKPKTNTVPSAKGVAAAPKISSPKVDIVVSKKIMKPVAPKVGK